MEITLDGRRVKAKNAATVAQLVSSLKLNREEVLVKLNGKLAADGQKISRGDEVKVMRVIFGG